MEPWLVIPAVGVILLVAGLLVCRPVRAASREARFAQVRRSFHVQREHLEFKFVVLAAAHGKPGGPDWEECDFDDDVAYVRNRGTGELSAFVAVTVAVDYDPSNDALGGLIGNLRSGTAVFRFDRDHWETDGRAFLNLSPTEAVRLYQNDLEMIEQELAHRP